MALNPHQRQTVAAVVALLILGFVTSCGSAEKSSTPVAFAPSSSVGPALSAQAPQASPTTTATQASANNEQRLGCGTYCQSAGGYGAPGDAGVEAVTILSSGTISLDPDGYFPLTVTCNLPVPCTGGILACVDVPNLTTMAMGCGRTEELVDPGETRTLGIPLPTPALGAINANGPTNINVTVDNRGVPQCADIPQLAAQCAAIPPFPGGPKPEGIVRLININVTVASPVSGFGSQSPDAEAASHKQLQQIAAGDRPSIEAELTDHWVPQLSSKRPGTIDDGFTWDDTLTLQEHQRLRDRYGAKLVWSDDWTSFDVKGAWVTVAPITFADADSALQWCSGQGLGANYCAAKLISATHPPAGTFAHQ